MANQPLPETNWTKENLEKALNVAIAVELFTIPVYLSAANSIVQQNRNDKIIPVTIEDGQATDGTKTENFSAFNVIMSVAVQEMFHLTLACNLCNALGFRPNIVAPDLDNPPSCLSPIKGMPVRGTLNDLIDTMIAIEKPDEQYIEPPKDPLSTNGPINYQESYKSIGDLYHALAYGVKKFWAYDKENDQYQKNNFQGKYQKINQIIKTLDDALIAMACIVEEGEGVGLGKFMSPEYVPTEAGAMFHDLDEVSHWDRFLDIKKYMKAGNTIPQYSTTVEAIVHPDATANLAQNYSILIQQLHDDFSTDNALDLRGMQQTQDYATQVFENGDIPQWNTIADPKPWPPVVNPHSCQGLNECAGQGYGNTGTAAGDGDCATAATHGCQESNNCKNQGGCGYAGETTKGKKQFAPRANACKNLGGCMSPISPDQYYNQSKKENPYAGQYVWDVARALFKENYTKANPGKPFKDWSGVVSQRRLNVEANSPKKSK